jgi:RecB family endonuclease NucS
MGRRSKQIEDAIKAGARGELFTSYEEELRKKSRQRRANGRSLKIPAANALLKKSGDKWGFDSEKALEDFVYDNLNNLLGLTNLKRQYYLNGEKTDILAIDEDRRLVLLELKNEQDRHIIQQLTRYYASLREEKPFQSRVDFSKPIRLIAIAPSFHKHSLIEREYNQLVFEFWKFEVTQENNNLYFLLENVDTGEVIKEEITAHDKDAYKLSENLPEPPKALQNILGKGTDDAKKRLLEIRERILGFHEQIQEITATGLIMYGRGKTKICAEINVDTGGDFPCASLIDTEPYESLYSSLKRPFLWLYLPIIHMGRPAVGRMRIRTNDWKNIASINYIPPGKKSSRASYNFHNFKQYMELTEATNQSDQLDVLIDIALETWLKRTL